jgi:hypothetical protein
VRKTQAQYVMEGAQMYGHLAASLLLLCIGRLADLEDLALATEDVLAAFSLVECLAGDNAVDFWYACQRNS